MKALLIISLLLAFTTALAQDQKVDSLLAQTHKYDSTLEKPQQKINSIQSSINNGTDSLTSVYHTPFEKLNSVESGLQNRTDSLQDIYRSPLAKLDSINSSFHQKADSLQNAFHSKISKLESVTSVLQRKTDSLNSLKLPTEKYTHKLDSIVQLKKQATAKAEEKLQKLKGETTEKLKTLELPPELQGKVSEATKGIDGFNLPGKNLGISSLKLPDNTFGKIGNVNLQSSMGNLGAGKLPEVGKLSEVSKLPEIGKLSEAGGEIKNVQGSMGDISKVTSQASGYGKDVQNIAKGNMGEVKQLPKDIENKAADLTGLDKVQGQTKALDQYKDQLGQVQNPDAMKEQAIKKVQEVAIDHFAGKEQVLQQAMEKMAKYKNKYSSLQSLEDATKKRHNEMRNKPIRERLLPGIGFQVHHKNDLLVDFNPYLGYRFNGRFTSGMGWNQRWAYNEKRDAFNAKGRIFGPRAYAEFNLFKGFFPRFELEAMNTFVPTTFATYTLDLGQREWVWSAFLGLKKNYRFLKKVNGTTSIMFNLYNPRHKSPYGDVVSMRFGFEFPIKKKKNKK